MPMAYFGDSISEFDASAALPHAAEGQ